MAGHSKWAQIKRKKAVTDVKKGAEYARFSKEISVAARLGGEDPEYNFRLRNAIERARVAGVPLDIIKKATNRSKDSDKPIEEVLYEGYGAHGVAVMIEGVTDNRNRTAAELRLILSKHKGSLGETGCVGWNFQRLGLISVALTEISDISTEEEKIFELVGDEADNIEVSEEDYSIYVVSQLSTVDPITQSLTKAGYKAFYEIEYVPGTYVDLVGEDIESVDMLEEALNNLDDVRSVWHNARY